MEDGDYVMLEGSMSSLHLESLEGSQEEKEPKISKEYIKPIRGDTIPPQYSKEITQYQPSDSERTRTMKDVLDAVWEFTHEPDINKDKKIYSRTMKEMWDYENGTMGPEKRKRDSDTSQRQSVHPQML